MRRTAASPRGTADGASAAGRSAPPAAAPTGSPPLGRQSSSPPRGTKSAPKPSERNVDLAVQHQKIGDGDEILGQNPRFKGRSEGRSADPGRSRGRGARQRGSAAEGAAGARVWGDFGSAIFGETEGGAEAESKG